MTEPLAPPKIDRTFLGVWVGIMIFIFLIVLSILLWGKETPQPISTPLFKGDYILLDGSFAGNLTFFQIETTGEKQIMVGHRIPVSLKISLARPKPTDGKLP